MCELNSPARWRRRWVQHTALRWACSRRLRRWTPWLHLPAWRWDGSREGELPLLSLLRTIPPFSQEVIVCSSSLPPPDTLTALPLKLYWEPLLSKWGVEVLEERNPALLSSLLWSFYFRLSRLHSWSFLSSSSLFMCLCKSFSPSLCKGFSHIDFVKRPTGTVVQGEQLQLSNALSSGPSLWFWQTGIFVHLTCLSPLPFIMSTLPLKMAHISRTI